MVSPWTFRLFYYRWCRMATTNQPPSRPVISVLICWRFGLSLVLQVAFHAECIFVLFTAQQPQVYVVCTRARAARSLGLHVHMYLTGFIAVCVHQVAVEEASMTQMDHSTFTPQQLSVEKLIKEQNFTWKVRHRWL